MMKFVLALLLALYIVGVTSRSLYVEELLSKAKANDFEEKFLKAIAEAEKQKTLTQTCDLRHCKDSDCGKNVTQLITSKGYPCEQHNALTSDGYFLSMQRIPHGLNQTNNGTRPVVLLQHGLEDASHTWVINEAYESLGFILADAGYDVWLGNNRGNTYSDTNEFYGNDEDEFWDFSWDEMASIDLPTQINYALEYTGQEKLHYIGHSEGTTQAFAGFENTTLASKVKLFVALAPVAYIGNMSARLIPLLADFHIDTILEIIGWNTFLVNHCWSDNALDLLCNIDDAFGCQLAMCAIMGCDPLNLNTTRYDVYVSLDPAGTSVQNMNHWGQMFRKDNYCKYDYLTRHQNEKHYGQAHPPCYNLYNMAAPVALFAGGKDDLADPTDVSRLISELNPDMIKYSTSISYYSHLDFVWGMDAYQVLYPQVLSVMAQYNS